MTYAAPRLGYLLSWATALLVISSSMAILWARRPGFLQKIPTFIPSLIDTSAWIYEFEAAPKDTRVYVGCDLRDGSYIGGYLDWYNTNVEEVSDRDIALVAPITVLKNNDQPKIDFGVVILSARDIAALYVSYVSIKSCESSAGSMMLKV